MAIKRWFSILHSQLPKVTLKAELTVYNHGRESLAHWVKRVEDGTS
ncbi:hypothetical protein OK016_17695 [Vibrio chagasii]|nr:hypothetical protein [Vibrio chagasii]